MDPEASAPRGASRTDAGVHAEGQVAAFDASRLIDARGWVLGLGSALDEDLAVRAARQVPVGFEPRAMSRGKRYRYRVLLDQVRDPLAAHAWRAGDPPAGQLGLQAAHHLRRLVQPCAHLVFAHSARGHSHRAQA
jgi:tRNA pseudouridine38-40 synthase